MKMLKEKLGKLYGTFYLNNNNGTKKKQVARKLKLIKI